MAALHLFVGTPLNPQEEEKPYPPFYPIDHIFKSFILEIPISWFCGIWQGLDVLSLQFDNQDKLWLEKMILEDFPTTSLSVVLDSGRLAIKFSSDSLNKSQREIDEKIDYVMTVWGYRRVYHLLIVVYL